MTTLTEAAKLFIDRQARRSHPEGKFDNGGRWYPCDAERRDCCRRLRTPSRAYPYSLMHHCRTADHIAKLTGHPATLIRREAKRLLALADEQS